MGGRDDGLTVTYTLREGLQWSDGEPLTAEDIAYTINRSRDEEWINHSARRCNLEAKALDERTVEIVTSVPDPKLPTMDVYIVPKHIYETVRPRTSRRTTGSTASAPDRTPSSDGPGESWTMVDNPNWYGREPAIDRIVFRIFENPARWPRPCSGRDRRRPRHPAGDRSRTSRRRRATSRSSGQPGRLHRAGA